MVNSVGNTGELNCTQEKNMGDNTVGTHLTPYSQYSTSKFHIVSYNTYWIENSVHLQDFQSKGRMSEYYHKGMTCVSEAAHYFLVGQVWSFFGAIQVSTMRT